MKARTFLALLAGSWLISPAMIAADSKADAIRHEMAKLKGVWQLVAQETDGRKMPDDQVKHIKAVIDDRRHTVYYDRQVLVQGMDFRIDPTKSPKQIRDTVKDGRTVRGIYEVEGDTLRLCTSLAGKEAPTEFKGSAGTGNTLRVFHRVPPEAK